MQEYLQKTRFGARLDYLGRRVLLLCVSFLFFILLWGVRIEAVVAGGALFVMLLCLLAKGEKRALEKKEMRLRRRIGGELAIERMLLSPQKEAHFEAALLYSTLRKAVLVRTGDDGVLCDKCGESVLVACSQTHEKQTVGAQDVLKFQRACKARRAARGVLFLTSPSNADARVQAEEAPRVTLYSRRDLVRIAGAAAPATDAQLVQLGKRRRQKHPAKRWLSHILAPERAVKYLWYALGLMLFYFLTGLYYYLLPALLCLFMMAGTRVRCRRHGGGNG